MNAGNSLKILIFTRHSWWSQEFQVKNLPCHEGDSVLVESLHAAEQPSPGTAKAKLACSRAPMPQGEVLLDAKQIS